MTAKSKAEIKAFFETSDRPTESQFVDLIDSYVDRSGPIGSIEAAASAGSQGFAFVSGQDCEVLGAAAALAFLGATVITTAQASAVAVDAARASLPFVTTAQVNAIATGAMSEAGIGGIPNGGYVTNRYYTGLGYGNKLGAGTAFTANRLYLRPFAIGASVTMTRIGIETVSAAAGNARLGIYNWANGVPTTLILDCGTVSTSSVANKEITISANLAPGIYGIGVVSNGSPQFYDIDADNDEALHFMGESSADKVDDRGLRVNHTYGALPSEVSGAMTYENSIPYMWLRKV